MSRGGSSANATPTNAAVKRSRIQSQNIENVVRDSLGESAVHILSHLTDEIKTHLENHQTCDLVYQKIMDRIRTTRKGVAAAISLLKEEFQSNIDAQTPSDHIGAGYILNFSSVDGNCGVSTYISSMTRTVTLLRAAVPDYTPSQTVLMDLQVFLSEIENDVNICVYKYPRCEESKSGVKFLKTMMSKLLLREPGHTRARSPPEGLISSASQSMFASLRLPSHLSASTDATRQTQSISDPPQLIGAHASTIGPSSRDMLKHSSSSNVGASPAIDAASLRRKNSSTLRKRTQSSLREGKYIIRNFISCRKSNRKLPKRNNHYRLGDSLLFGGHLKATGEMPPKIINSFTRPISTELKPEAIQEEFEERVSSSEENAWTVRWTDNNSNFMANVETVRRLKKSEVKPEAPTTTTVSEAPLSRPTSAATVSAVSPIKEINGQQQRTEKWLDALVRNAVYQSAEKKGEDVEYKVREQDGRQNASKTLVRHIVDEFVLDDTSSNSEGILLSLFLEILSHHSEESRIRAFDLLYNIQVHIQNLLDHHTDKDNISKLGTLDRHQAKKVAALGNNSQDIINSLYDIFADMLLYLWHNDEMSEAVWLASFKVLIFLLTDRGRILKSKLQTLDIRLIVVMSDRIGSKLDVETERLLSRLLVNGLYRTTLMLDVKLLSQACHSSVTQESRAIDAIITKYVRARSLEQRENMFVILYDYIVDQLNTKTARHTEIVNRASADIIWFLDLLRAINAPYHFVDAFLITPKNFGERIWNTLTGIWPSFAAKVDKQFALLVLQEGFEKLANQYTKLSPEVESALEGHHLGEHRLEMLTALLSSPYPFNKRSGERWLTELILHHLDDPNVGWLNSSSHSSDPINKMFLSLCQSTDTSMKRSFLNITQNLLISLRYRMSTWGEESIVNKMATVLNDNIQKLIKLSSGEKPNSSILRGISDLILYFLCNPLEEPLEDGGEVDVLATHFLNGRVEVSKNCLKHLNINHLLYLLTWLPDLTDNTSTRVMFLHLFIVKIKTGGSLKESLESIGGIPFMQKLISDPEPTVCYLAARFIIEHMERENQDQYLRLLKGLLLAAQERDDGDRVVYNQFWQIKKIGEMIGEKKKQ